MTRRLLLLALCFPAFVRGEDDLGRLFTTPEQRRALEKPAETVHPRAMETKKVQAIFRRTDTEPVVLVGGEPARAGQSLRSGVQVLAIDDAAVELRVPGHGTVRLAPGATFPIPRSGATP